MSDNSQDRCAACGARVAAGTSQCPDCGIRFVECLPTSPRPRVEAVSGSLIARWRPRIVILSLVTCAVTLSLVPAVLGAFLLLLAHLIERRWLSHGWACAVFWFGWSAIASGRVLECAASLYAFEVLFPAFFLGVTFVGLGATLVVIVAEFSSRRFLSGLAGVVSVPAWWFGYPMIHAYLCQMFDVSLK